MGGTGARRLCAFLTRASRRRRDREKGGERGGEGVVRVSHEPTFLSVILCKTLSGRTNNCRQGTGQLCAVPALKPFYLRSNCQDFFASGIRQARPGPSLSVLPRPCLHLGHSSQSNTYLTTSIRQTAKTYKYTRSWCFFI